MRVSAIILRDLASGQSRAHQGGVCGYRLLRLKGGLGMPRGMRRRPVHRPTQSGPTSMRTPTGNQDVMRQTTSRTHAFSFEDTSVGEKYAWI